ncbi:fatty acid-binding protein 10-A, liver basic isoform X1 [Labeo rohita]|uniref:fatty acid-binding protein 10-A, liver basic isoform X1 n=1 Tax=Labeo rohita TaxID=84645 RepID=UPI0021E201C9|nr:fatty acid-binding protein 10-A, liver basic isoform X1 [Labeo rohita]
MAVDFSGSWKLYEQENAEEFLRAVSAPEIYIKMMNEVKPLTTIRQNGDEFSICVKTPLRTNTNTFTIGAESEFSTMDGQKIKVIHSNESPKRIRTCDSFDPRLPQQNHCNSIGLSQKNTAAQCVMSKRKRVGIDPS